MCDFAKRQAPTIAKAMRKKRLRKDKAALRRRRIRSLGATPPAS
jgi:hypothetical protein